ncbi:hypothetical protein NDU88_004284 [Pleurodeles waltl]|uniref:Uncharacterized protein n=1 Tax=Pleurodeles waltl TaxID=8319 RepID=A0AAV7PG81_PLEWA|nr:hypothetical protein NDU88_004284 [Pleurodeles waltl]
MQICAAERSEAERHLRCVRVPHLTRAIVLSLAACRGASPLSGARSADSRARPPPVAGGSRGQRCSDAARTRFCVRTSAASPNDDGPRRVRPHTHGESRRRSFVTGCGRDFGGAVSRGVLLLPSSPNVVPRYAASALL